MNKNPEPPCPTPAPQLPGSLSTGVGALFPWGRVGHWGGTPAVPLLGHPLQRVCRNPVL